MESIAAWLQYLQVEKGLLPSTIRMYARELRLVQRLHPNLPNLDTATLRSYLNQAGGKASTIANRIAALRSYYGFLVRTDHRNDDPTQRIDRPKQRKGIPKPVENRTQAFQQLPHQRARLVATFLIETGLRISEACNLQLAPPAPEQIIVKGKGAKERIVLLTPKARRAFDDLGGEICYQPRTIQRWFAQAGFTPHQLRHTLACDLITSGADLGEVQEILGHSSPATTRIYARYNTTRLRKALNRRYAT